MKQFRIDPCWKEPFEGNLALGWEALWTVSCFSLGGNLGRITHPHELPKLDPYPYNCSLVVQEYKFVTLNELN